MGYWKPVETGCDPLPQDAQLLSNLLNQPLSETVTYTYRYPLAPYVAQRYENKPLKISLLKKTFEALKKKYDLLVVEGAGGLAVPLKKNYTYADFAKELHLPTLIVSDARLGTINDSFLTAFYARSRGLNLLGFAFNRFTGKDMSERDNPQVVEEMTNLPVLAKIPFLKRLDDYRLSPLEVESILNRLGL